jgi:hypothetical protein
MLETTIAGSLPKPAWLAKPRILWAPWQLEGEALVEAKRGATLLALKEQEDAGIGTRTAMLASPAKSSGMSAAQRLFQGTVWTTTFQGRRVA